MFGKIGIALVALMALVGCATTAGQQVLDKTNLGADTVKALQDLKAELQPVLATVGEDAAATRAWSNKVLGPQGTSPDVLKYRLANACPDATDAVGGAINQTLDNLIAQVQSMTGQSADPTAPKGRLMLFLTQLKYGPQADPKAQLAALQASMALQMDALFTGCAHLFPKKQVNDILRLAAKAGITGFTGGAAAPFFGVLP